MRRFIPRLVVPFAVFSCLCVVSLNFSPARMNPARTARASTRATHKVVLRDGKALPARAEGKTVAEYAGFRVLEVPDAALDSVKALPGATVRDDFDFVLLNRRSIDTAAEKASKRVVLAGGGPGLHLVQFAGPIRPEWHAALRATGARVVNYVPSNALLVYVSGGQREAVRTFAAQNAFVQWNAPLDPADKLQPELATTKTDRFAVQLVRDAAANTVSREFVNKLNREGKTVEFGNDNFVNLVFHATPDALAALAALPDVVSIAPFGEPTQCDERQAVISAGLVSAGQPVPTDYAALLASWGFTQAQFDASNLAVDVTDSGFDNGTTSPFHFGLLRGGFGGTSRVAYTRVFGTPGTSAGRGCDGHGNLCGHIVAGNVVNTPPGSSMHADGLGFRYGMGIAPFVKIGSSVIFDPFYTGTGDFAGIQSQAYGDGARVSSNSWESSGNGVYSGLAQLYDGFVRDAQSATAGNQQMTIAFAAGNSGGIGTVRPPATGKNVITVGGSENYRLLGTTDGCSTGDGVSDNADEVYGSSSRGPCNDGRNKPDVAAPATRVTGGVPQSATPGPTGTAGICFGLPFPRLCGTSIFNPFFPDTTQWTTVSNGTSFACPAVAGGAALVQQQFLNNPGYLAASRGPTLTAAASPALTKAYLVNSARYLTGSGGSDTLPSVAQGFGAMNLGTAFDATPRTVRDQVADDVFTASGQARTFNLTVADATKPLRVTLAWTDAPGSTVGNAYVNDLDLTVTVGGNTYLGNVFTGANSTTGGTADFRNNLENVFLPAGLPAGTPVTVTILASNIAGDGVPGNADALDQDFALVATNATDLPVQNAGLSLAVTNTQLAPSACTPGYAEEIVLDATLTNTGGADLSNLTFEVVELREASGAPSPAPFRLLTADGAGCATRGLLGARQAVAGGTLTTGSSRAVQFRIAIPARRRLRFLVNVRGTAGGGLMLAGKAAGRPLGWEVAAPIGPGKAVATATASRRPASR